LKYSEGDLVICRTPFMMFFDSEDEQLLMAPAQLEPGDVGMCIDSSRVGETAFMFGNAVLYHLENGLDFSVNKIEDCIEVFL
tara:strand:+ start:13902 stop:14147 length:246 start_codon:yes stop_codon:yes gene_type:complete